MFLKAAMVFEKPRRTWIDLMILIFKNVPVMILFQEFFKGNILL